MKLTMQNIQLMLATILILSGLILLYLGLFMPPMGVIDSSVLVAFGETCTFGGALIGVDYHYRIKSTAILQTDKQVSELLKTTNNARTS